MSLIPLPGNSRPRRLYKAPIFRCPIPGCPKVCHTSGGVKLHIGVKHPWPTSPPSLVQSRAGVLRSSTSPTLPLPEIPTVEDTIQDIGKANDDLFGGEDMHLDTLNAGPSEQIAQKVTVTMHPQLDGMMIQICMLSYITDTCINGNLFRDTCQ